MTFEMHASYEYEILHITHTRIKALNDEESVRVCNALRKFITQMHQLRNLQHLRW